MKVCAWLDPLSVCGRLRNVVLARIARLERGIPLAAGRAIDAAVRALHAPLDVVFLAITHLQLDLGLAVDVVEGVRLAGVAAAHADAQAGGDGRGGRRGVEALVARDVPAAGLEGQGGHVLLDRAA